MNKSIMNSHLLFVLIQVNERKGDAPETSHAPDLRLFASHRTVPIDRCVPGSVPLRDVSCCIPFALVESVCDIKRTRRFELLFSFVLDIRMNHVQTNPDR